MKVNGIDLKEKYGSKIRIGQQTIRERTIVNFTNWIDEYDNPTPGQEPKHKFFDVEAELIVIGTSKTDAELTVSNIIADCRSGEIELDNVDLILTGELKEAEKEYRDAIFLAVTSQTMTSERSRYIELNKNIAEHRAEVAERALDLCETAYILSLNHRATEGVSGQAIASDLGIHKFFMEQAEKELAEERKDEQMR